jgi:hypothetical protein
MNNHCPGVSLLEELDARQDELLHELEQLNGRIERVISEALAWRGLESQTGICQVT